MNGLEIVGVEIVGVDLVEPTDKSSMFDLASTFNRKAFQITTHRLDNTTFNERQEDNGRLREATI